jgi:hypothetical protein
MVQKIATLTGMVLLVASAAAAAERGSVRGEYVEARTAEIFAGG